VKYTTGQLETIAAKLRDAPHMKKIKQHSRQEAVRVLSKEIAALQKRGYTLNQIAETLQGEGLSIATPTLKNYLQRAKQSKKAPHQATVDTLASSRTASQAASASKAAFTSKPDSDDI